MPAFINTNIASLNAQRNLNTSQSQLTTSLQRLSSGLRINSAKDDAAGLAIANRFTTQINGQDQASRNANDAISLAQTAEGALGEMTNNLQRIRELSVQAANSTNSDSDRAAINQEVQQRLSEIDRTASTTNFNGQKILDGSFGSANFQIGANVGESINVNLSTSMRNSATGKIATATAGTLGASTGTNGNVKSTLSTTASDLNFAAQGSADTAGSVSFTATSFDFSAGLVAGTSSAQTVTAGDFSTAGVAQVDSSATSGTAVTAKDYSGTNLAQFNVNIAGSTTATVGITLNTDYSSGGKTTADLAKDVQDQIRATAGNENVSVSIDAGKLKITNTGKMGAGNAVTITGADTNASEISSGGSPATTDNGTAATATTNLSMKVDGTTITLNGDHSSDGLAGVAAELTQKMKASGLTGASDYSAAVNGGKIVITHANSATAVAISGTDANAQAAGFADTAGVAGSGSATSKAASLKIDGHDVSLNSNYGSYAGLAGALQTQLGGSYNVTSTSGGAITIDRTTTGASSTAIDITNGDANTAALGITAGAKTGTAGTYATAGGAADFFVDGNKVHLNTDYSTGAAGHDTAQLATDITAQLTAAGSSVTATVGAGADAGKIVFTSSNATAVNITGADAKATTAGFAFQSGTAGSATGTLSMGDFQINGIQLGGGSGPAKSYANTGELATAINNNVAGVYASVDKTTGALSLSSSSDIKLAGAAATGATGFNATSAVADKGDLSKIDVSTAAGALTAIQRTDSALTNVSSLRSTFGAMQNRFESVISNLASATENLSAARSRLQDTDFASETAKMTRGQILQQAGTAMLAQANSLPNGVLSLLRG